MKTLLKILLFLCLFPFSLAYVILKRRKHGKSADARAAGGSPGVNLHFDLLNEAAPLYSSVVKSKNYSGASAVHLEALLQKDIALAPKIYADLKRDFGVLPRYPAFKQLAILYERRGELERAAEVCRLAIKGGFDDDGTASKMRGRLARLEKHL